MHPYDAILGFDWLQTHSPMEYDWKNKTLQFSEKGKLIKLQGLTEPTMQLSSMLATKVYNATKGSDVWAFVLVDQLPATLSTTTTTESPAQPKLTNLLQSFKDVFTDPKVLPPTRTYDHAIPLMPSAVPINSRQYHYSPMHKIEIENQVKQLLQEGLIAHSHSPFA
jgi:hypothetical protein